MDATLTLEAIAHRPKEIGAPVLREETEALIKELGGTYLVRENQDTLETREYRISLYIPFRAFARKFPQTTMRDLNDQTGPFPGFKFVGGRNS